MNMRCVDILLLELAIFITLPTLAKGQSLDALGDSSSTVASTVTSGPERTYIRPTQATKIRNYFFDAYGPYPLVGSAFAAGINQADNTPPEWKQGSEGYGKRFGSDLAIAAVSTTARYTLAEAFREDMLYYRCDCKGVFPRFGNAVISTFTARRGEDGHRVFSFPAFVAPYAGTMTAVYAWFPGRYSAKDAFRMGNYSMLGYMSANVVLEFLYSGPHSLRSRMHLNNAHGAPDPSTKP